MCKFLCINLLVVELGKFIFVCREVKRTQGISTTDLVGRSVIELVFEITFSVSRGLDGVFERVT